MNAATARTKLPPPLRRSLIRITVSGGLAMVYFAGVMSPALTEFFRSLGAQEFHFGLLGGIPLVMLGLQFVGAAITNRVRRRKPFFMAMLLLSRLLFVPLVLVPTLFPAWSTGRTLTVMIVILALSRAAMNLGSPPFFAWMADLIPHRVLSSYWGVRQRIMSFTWAATYVVLAAFVGTTDLPIERALPLVILVAVAAGVTDILLYSRVHEPPNQVTTGRSAWDVLLEPLRHREYGRFVLFACAWQTSAMFAATFMAVYTLKFLGLPVWQVTLLFCLSGMGNAVVARRWGRLADRHGNTPVLKLTLALKPMIALAYLLVSPATAVWVLAPVLLIDGGLNGGLLVAQNGFMMKIAPQQNRSMFIAAITGLAGLCGGIAAMGAGAFLHATASFAPHWLGRTWNHYHLVFLISFLARSACNVLVHRIHEPRRSPSVHVLNDFLGASPARMLRFPIGLYRRGLAGWTRNERSED